MPGNPRSWKPNDWEDHCQLLLKKRYASPPGSYQHIPATTQGDCGLEGYAVDGTGYQCYAAQDWANSAQLYEKQRNKITRDIGTFISRQDELVEILGTIKISLWNLFVPYWNNKELLKHAKTKEQLVKEHTPKHIAEDFRIAILTEEDFATEVQQLANVDLYRFDLVAPAVAADELDRWMADTEKLELVANLSRKATLIGGGKSEEKKQKFQARMVAHYISGNILLGKLQQEQPETYGRIIEYKVAREINLEAEAYSTTKIPAEFLDATLQQYRSELLTIPGISPRVAESFAHEAVSDWLVAPWIFDDDCRIYRQAVSQRDRRPVPVQAEAHADRGGAAPCLEDRDLTPRSLSELPWRQEFT
jgi:hypothetical protein